VVWLIATFVLCTSLLTKYTIQGTLGWLQRDNAINYHVLFFIAEFSRSKLEGAGSKHLRGKWLDNFLVRAIEVL